MIRVAAVKREDGLPHDAAANGGAAEVGLLEERIGLLKLFGRLRKDGAGWRLRRLSRAELLRV